MVGDTSVMDVVDYEKGMVKQLKKDLQKVKSELKKFEVAKSWDIGIHVENEEE